jgi:hypothetical protein
LALATPRRHSASAVLPHIKKSESGFACMKHKQARVDYMIADGRWHTCVVVLFQEGKGSEQPEDSGDASLCPHDTISIVSSLILTDSWLVLPVKPGDFNSWKCK